MCWVVLHFLKTPNDKKCFSNSWIQVLNTSSFIIYKHLFFLKNLKGFKNTRNTF